MSSPISRRTLAKGAAWAAPVVAATATVPAYAASKCEKTKELVQEAFDKWESEYVPNFSGSTLRLWWATPATHTNGAGLVASILRAQWSGDTSADIVNESIFGLEIAQRNVGTSPAINNSLSGKTLPRTNTKMPTVWPPPHSVEYQNR